jgi:hypothetical protein
MRLWAMRTSIVGEVTAADRVRLEAVVADRNSSQKHVWRARIVLLTAEGHGIAEIMRRIEGQDGRVALAGSSPSAPTSSRSITA